jgi:hypothetical protein
MSRRALCGVLILSLLTPSLAAAGDETRAAAAPAGAPTSTSRRVLWTLVGAGAGFAAGLVFGLRQFDDAIDSDRKVWTSAVVGAAAGGVAGALISGAGSSRPSRQPQPVLQMSFEWPIASTPEVGLSDADLRQVVRRFNSQPPQANSRDERRPAGW